MPGCKPLTARFAVRATRSVAAFTEGIFPAGRLFGIRMPDGARHARCRCTSRTCLITIILRAVGTETSEEFAEPLAEPCQAMPAQRSPEPRSVKIGQAGEGFVAGVFALGEATRAMSLFLAK
jgi:hypothetical protein